MEMPNEFTLRSSHQELLQAQAHVWNQILNLINSMSLKCAIELGIPDIIHKHGKPMTLSDLVKTIPINKSKSRGLYRLMSILIYSKFFVMVKISHKENEQDEGYWLTPASRLLLRDEPFSVASLVRAILDPVMTDPWHNVAAWFQNDDATACVTTHGMKFYELTRHVPRLNQFFNEAMASDSHLASSVLIGDNKQVLEGLKSIVDVGGGTGTVAKAIASAFPEMKCTVLDLPHVVAGSVGTENLAFIEGDMFQFIPPADAVFLKWILHNWNDEECVQILVKCKKAISSANAEDKRGRKVIIVDMVVDDEKNVENEAKETQLFLDMHMMALFEGRQRTEKEWEKLFFDAGFANYKITHALGLRSLIEVFP
uniref:O-methyltransferase n=1 Tax=Scoparia dulcis TaxID=107240 RepID=A0A5H2Q6H1_SCODU|nr:O-methyltransferase [Scoparia dulcis]